MWNATFATMSPVGAGQIVDHAMRE
jgi:hypothetical protein